MDAQQGKTIRTVGVILVNWNGAEYTIPCIESLLSGIAKPDRIVVVDNASADNSPELIKSRFPEVELIRNRQNEGFTGANNCGISRLISARCDYIWILNNDTTIDESCLSTLKNYMDLHPDVSACTGKILYDGNENLVWYAGAVYKKWTIRFAHHGQGEEDRGQFDRIEKVPFVSGCSMFIRREAIELIGMFDNHFFAYNEDSDWCLRASNANLKIYYVPQAIIRHKVSATVNKLKKRKTGGTTSQFSVYITNRNRLFLIRKHSRNALQTCVASLAAAIWFCYYFLAVLVLLRTDKLIALVMAFYDGITLPIDGSCFRTSVPRYLR